MPPQRTATDGPVRSPAATGRNRALHGICWAVVLTLLFAWMPDRSKSNPVSPLVVDRAFGLSGAKPWVSPTGEQLVTYLRQGENGLTLPVVEARIAGGPFGPLETLSTTSATSAPVLGFGPDGSALIAWHSSSGTAEQVLRPAEAEPRPPTPVGSCIGLVERSPIAIATSAAGRILSACTALSGTTPPWTVLAGVGQMPSAIAPDVEVVPAFEELTSDPLVAWGADGTGIVAFGYLQGDSPEEWKIAARVIAPDGSLGEPEVVDSAADPARLIPTGVAVLPNGTVAITADSSDGALLFTKAAGPGRSFERIVTGEDRATMPAADSWGRLHFLGSRTDGSGKVTWSSRVLDLDGSLRDPIPVPTRDTGFEPVEAGFQVFQSGGEALVMKSATGFSVFFRSPGPGGFFLPRQLAAASTAGPGSVTRTPAGDLLLTWEEEVAPERKRVMLGGWDASGRPVIERISFPRRARRGARVALSVVAYDTMGISRVVWKFPGNRKVEGASVKVRLWKRGVNRIQVSVIDRAGNRTTRTRRIKVVQPRPPARQGRAGTSGSPRP